MSKTTPVQVVEQRYPPLFRQLHCSGVDPVAPRNRFPATGSTITLEANALRGTVSKMTLISPPRAFSTSTPPGRRDNRVIYQLYTVHKPVILVSSVFQLRITNQKSSNSTDGTPITVYTLPTSPRGRSLRGLVRQRLCFTQLYRHRLGFPREIINVSWCGLKAIEVIYFSPRHSRWPWTVSASPNGTAHLWGKLKAEVPFPNIEIVLERRPVQIDRPLQRTTCVGSAL